MHGSHALLWHSIRGGRTNQGIHTLGGVVRFIPTILASPYDSREDQKEWEETLPPNLWYKGRPKRVHGKKPECGTVPRLQINYLVITSATYITGCTWRCHALCGAAYATCQERNNEDIQSTSSLVELASEASTNSGSDICKAARRF